MKWSDIGEWAYIIIFCISYSLIANIESRLFPAPNTMAQELRAKVFVEIDRINRELARDECEQLAIKTTTPGTAIIWYYDPKRYEYWCGLIKLQTLTVERARQLKPFIIVLNSDKGIDKILDAKRPGEIKDLIH